MAKEKSTQKLGKGNIENLEFSDGTISLADFYAGIRISQIIPKITTKINW